MTSVGDVVAQLREVIERLDRSVTAAGRVQAEAAQAQSSFTEAGQGTDHPRIRQAVMESRTAGEKAGKVARLLAEAGSHLAAYVNVIAPGSAPSRDQALPTGDQLVREAEDKGNNVDRFIRRHVKKADQTEGNLQNTETVATEGLKKLVKIYKSQPGYAGTHTPTPQPPPIDRPQVEHPGTAIAIVAGAAAVGVRQIWIKIKDRHERKNRGSQT
jgi:hypothetical protein